jgi:hypothetical protein
MHNGIETTQKTLAEVMNTTRAVSLKTAIVRADVIISISIHGNYVRMYQLNGHFWEVPINTDESASAAIYRVAAALGWNVHNT